MNYRLDAAGPEATHLLVKVVERELDPRDEDDEEVRKVPEKG
jgi:hypothetical protein